MFCRAFYNLFEPVNTQAVREILKAGHRIGLHFDRMAYPETPAGQMASLAAKDAAVLGDWFETEIKVLSYHRPTPREVEGHPEESHPLLNTYMPAFTKQITYFSDSQGSFRFGHRRRSKSDRGES